jgi:hypothetical protein
MGTRRITFSKQQLAKIIAQYVNNTMAGQRGSWKDEIPFVPSDSFVCDMSTIERQDAVVFTLVHPSFKDDGMKLHHFEFPEQVAGVDTGVYMDAWRFAAEDRRLRKDGK